jgi:hypothetical protein
MNTTKYVGMPLTSAEATRRVVVTFKRRNPDAKPMRIRWIRRMRLIEYRNGQTGYIGFFEAPAPGFATRYCAATADADCTMIN